MINLDDLKRPFRPHEIDWRVGATTQDKTKGMALAYMDARAVMERLDKVCGAENWQCRYNHVGTHTSCEIGIRLTEWVWKSDGAGDTDYEGVKGAFSDAFKRAAARWGIGRYLYDMDAPWVPVAQRGRSYVITDEGKTTLNKYYRQAVWRGPLSVTELKAAMKTFINHLGNAPTVEDVDALVAANEALLDQCEYDEPSWFYGGGDVASVHDRIEGRRDELSMKEVA